MDADSLTLGQALRAAAERDSFLLVCEDGSRTSAAEIADASARLAGSLGAIGLERGDRVALMMHNGPEYVVASFAVAGAGMIEVPVHVDYRDSLLAHVLSQSGARVVICDAKLLGRITALKLPSLPRIVIVGDSEQASGQSGGATAISTFQELVAGDPDPRPATVSGEDVSSICYTSGTSGPSKGAVLTHSANLHLARSVVDFMSYDQQDVIYCVFPLSHINAKYTAVLAGLLVGARVVIDDRFSASRHWERMRGEGVTAFNYMGSMLSMIAKQPERPDDAQNPVTRCYGAACPEPLWEPFEQRFGVRLHEHYGMTEIGIATMNTATRRRVGSCGFAAPYFDARIADEHDREAPVGTVGEIQIRPRLPNIIFEEYWQRPDATIAAVRNLWFHTGDRGRVDADGFFYFADRLKDCIRRRGENISSWEIESVINTHPAVLESAAYGVPDELGEEEVMVAVVLRPGAQLSAPELLDYCHERLARFQVPRYLAFRPELPKTMSQRVQKFALRKIGVDAGTYDRTTES